MVFMGTCDGVCGSWIVQCACLSAVLNLIPPKAEQMYLIIDRGILWLITDCFVREIKLKRVKLGWRRRLFRCELWGKMGVAVKSATSVAGALVELKQSMFWNRYVCLGLLCEKLLQN